MPGAGRSDSRTVRLLGALLAVVAIVGYVAFDWRFGQTGSAVPTAIAVFAVAVAVGRELWTRLG